MFGSDWPVCGVGPGTNFVHQPCDGTDNVVGDGDEARRGSDEQGESGSRETSGTAWTEWRDVVERLLEASELDEVEREWVWWRTAGEAYGVELDRDVSGAR